VVGAYGNRYATDFYEGYVGAGAQQHLLTAGGLVGTIASAHSSKREPTELEVVGLLTAGGRPLSLDDFARVPEPVRIPAGGTIVIVGSSMNAGKTTTAAAILRGLGRAGLRAGAGKVTGSGSGKDRWSYADAGAVAICEFLNFGMPSTFGYPLERLRTTTLAIRDALVADGAEAVVLEIADGLLQEDTADLLPVVAQIADAVVLAASDAMAGACGLQILHRHGIELSALSGLLTASPLARREAETVTGTRVLSPAELADGAALDLLSERCTLTAGLPRD
jgi:hypothetical protein